jgi:predicted transcriptional regulator
LRAIEQLYLLEKIERGIEDADNGKLMDHDESFDELEAPGA